jgi:hypothetical protein
MSATECSDARVKRIPRSQSVATALDATLRRALAVPARERFAVAIAELRYVGDASVPGAAVER